MINYRPHKSVDVPAIESLVTTVFTEAANEAEGTLVGKLAGELISLTQSNDLYGFVAEMETHDGGNEIIGAIFFSRLTFETPIDAFILSPVAIKTSHQRQGIGQALIRHGLAHLKQAGVKLVMTYGDPNYYSKVGFEPVSEDTIQAPHKLSQPIGWIGQSLSENAHERIEVIPGRVKCVEALDDGVYW